MLTWAVVGISAADLADRSWALSETQLIGVAVFSSIVIGLWLIYLMRSKRVHATYVMR